MSRRWTVAALAGAALVVAGLVGCHGTSEAPAAGAFTASLANTTCPSQVGDVLSGGYSCQLLTVRPEADGAPAIRLLVTTVEPSDGRSAADPVVIVGEDYGSAFNYAGLAPVADRLGRTVYLLNPRGVAGSQPDLSCRGVDELASDTLAAGGGEDALSRWLDAVRECHQALTSGGVDLASFGADAMPGDVLALTTALDLDSWNIGAWGTAGSVALRLADQHPDGLRAVFLDSPSVPADDPRVTLDADTRRGLQTLFDDCERDQACRTLPHSFAALDAAAAHLDAHPVDARFEAAGKRVDVHVDGSTFTRLVRAALSAGSTGTTVSGAGLPAILAAADRSWDRRQTAALFGMFGTSAPYCDGYLATCPYFHRTTLGVYLTDLCRDHDPFPQLPVGTDAVGRLAAGSPYVDACNSWPVDEASDPPPATVGGDVPVLAFVGEYTPYSDGARVRAFLADDPHAHVVEVQGWGHNAVAAFSPPDTCLGDVRQAFFADPTADLDLSCVDVMPRAPSFLPRV